MTRTILGIAGFLTVGIVGTAALADAQALPGSPGQLRRAATQPVLADQLRRREASIARAARSSGGDLHVVVKLKESSLAAYGGGVGGLRATSPSATGRAQLDISSTDSVRYLGFLNATIDEVVSRATKRSPSVRVTQRFDVVIGGVAMRVPASEIARLAADPAVEAVLPDVLEQPNTDATPAFLDAPTTWNLLGGQQSAGEGVVVGVIDTGIWPEHPSLADPDPSGKPFPAPPAPPVGTRSCDFSSGANPGPPFACNNKLIGAQRFMDTYDIAVGPDPGGYTSSRDHDGHGTHTATTAAGDAAVAASILGVARGNVSGIAPRAHVIAYKVCGDAGCLGSDMAAAVQEAIKDGVKVINFSISGGSDPFGDPVSLAFLDAYNAGIFVAASAGNSGPAPDTTDHREPWVTTVAASTSDRAFVGSATLTSTDTATLVVPGVSVSPPLATGAAVVNAAAAPYLDVFCSDDTADGAFAGKVVICMRGGGVGRAQKGFNVLQRGAAGMLVVNPAMQDLGADNHWLPAIQLQNDVGAQVLAFLGAHPGVTATIASGVATGVQGDVMAEFSSRGGPEQPLGISKPDVTAPGVQILAGHTPTPTDPAGGPPGELFQAIAGTSMSSPHVAGAGALLRALNPTWTPGQIKSALMTTAHTAVVKEDEVTPTTPFDDGSGRIDLGTASDPGFTFDATGADFVANKDALFKTNYPSLYLPALGGVVTVQRTLRSVHRLLRTYSVQVDAPADLKITAPKVLSLSPGASKTIDITVDAKDVPLGETRFASLTFRPGNGRSFVFPITIVRRHDTTLAVENTCAPNPIARGANTTCTVKMTNNGPDDALVQMTDALPGRLRLVRGSTVGGTETGGGDVAFTGTIPGVQDPSISIAPGVSPAGYLPLAAFAIPPVGGVGDETLHVFNVPAFDLAGVTYTQVGFASNGYLVLGGGSAPDISFQNQLLPDPARPNNVLAPFWTDLDPGTAGAMRIGSLTDGVSEWLVFEWEAVPEFAAANSNSFQVWIGLKGDATPTEDVTFTYGTIQGNGALGKLTVGAENPQGTSGGIIYFDGAGSLPNGTTELRVTGTPGAVSSHTVTFQATGILGGTYVTYARVTGDSFDGTVTAKFVGTITGN